jgi:hypothetical protein
MVNFLKRDARNYLIAALAGALVVALVQPGLHASFAPTIVRSLQRGTITINAGNVTTGTATLGTTLTSTTKTLCTFDGALGGASVDFADGNALRHSIDLTNTTTITGRRTIANANSVASTVYYTCVEFF